MTRRSLSLLADISERHLTNLEGGKGNPGILLVHRVAHALQCTMADLLGDVTTTSQEWRCIRELLGARSEAELFRARNAIGGALALGGLVAGSRRTRVALLGLRGAGKSTLGAMLAESLGYAFVDLSKQVEGLAGCTSDSLRALYGQVACRRYERRALKEAIQTHPRVVIEVSSGFVDDPLTFDALLSDCTTVWLYAPAEDHVHRVASRGRRRLARLSEGALDDLSAVLGNTASLYGRADVRLNTGTGDVQRTFSALRSSLETLLEIA